MKDRFTREMVRRGYAKDYRQARQLRERLQALFPGTQSDEALLSLVIQPRSPNKA